MRISYIVSAVVMVLAGQAFSQEDPQAEPPNQPTSGEKESVAESKPWVVLSNLSFRREGIAGVFEADYELVEGEPEAGAEYVWVVQVGVGTRLKKYAEVPIKLQPPRGHLKEAFRGLGSVAGNPESYVAKKIEKPAESRSLGPAHEKISGVLKEGEAKSAAKRPPTIAELAGPGAVGKLFAIANPAIVPDRQDRKSFSVEFQLQGEPNPEARYFWVVKPAGGRPIQFDITLTVRRTEQGQGKLIAAPRGVEIDEKQGPFEMSIETPKGDSALRGPRETISNTVKLE